MGVTYEEIDNFILTGKTNENALVKIKDMFKKSNHKREPIPVYNKHYLKR